MVVMGISGTGKSLIGGLVAGRLRVPFEDADDLHPPANVAKMRAGVPLSDEDRAPWLDAVGSWLAAHPGGGVMACSALRRAYRDRLRAAAPSVWFAHLRGDEELIRSRMRRRRGHFMPASLLDSQRATLEPLGPDEAGASFDVSRRPDELVDEVLTALDRDR